MWFFTQSVVVTGVLPFFTKLAVVICTAIEREFLMLGSSRRLILVPVSIAIGLAAVGCGKSDEAKPNSTTISGASATGKAGSTTLSNTNPDARLAQAKTVAVGFFEAQAVNDWEKALKRSSGGAELTIKWAQAVNTIAAANGTPFQVPSVTAPNVRVQLDELAPSGDGRWTAKGFVELSFRPGPVATATTTVNASNTSVAPGGSAGAFVVDLVFTGDGDALKLDDYRLDDTPYPVSQLFMAPKAPTERAGGVAAQLTLAHRDLDGSVQFVLAAKNEKDQPIRLNSASFDAIAPLAGGTSVPSKADTPVASPSPVKGTLLADALKPATDQAVLVVLGGAFPGSAGTLTLVAGSSGATPAIPTTLAPSGTIPATEMRWTVEDWPALTPRPLRTVASSTSTTSSSTTTTTTSSSTTSTSAPTTKSTVTIPAPPTVTAPTTTASSVPQSSTSVVATTTITTVPR